MADDEDPVTREINIYLSKTLADKLYLFQYPLRPKNMTMDDVEHLACRIKPKQKKVELELGINTRSENYARSKGEQIAINVDSGAATSSQYYRSSMMDKQVTSSVLCPDLVGRYAAGVLKDGELHLTPLNAVVQLRPTFNYLDKADNKIKTEFGGGDTGGESSQDEAEEEAKPVTMKFAGQETDEAKARRLASYKYLQMKQDEESWINMEHHGIDSGRAVAERMKLLSGGVQTVSEESSEFNMQPKEYLCNLVPPTWQTEEEKPDMPSNVLSLTQLRNMPLPDQIKVLLTNAKVIRFSQLMALLPQGTDNVVVLRSLQQVAVLVQGCWVVKSEVLYPKEMVSPHSGVSSEHLCKGRDYVMWRFTLSRNVTRKDIASVVKLPAEDVKDILEQMSRIHANCGWEFLFANDNDFINRYPDIVQRQKMLWDAKYQGLCAQLKIPKEHEKKFKEKDQGMPGAEKPTRRRRSSSRGSRKRTLSGRSISDHSDMEMDIGLSTEDDPESKIDLTNSSPVVNSSVESNGASESNTVEVCSKLLKTELLTFVQEKLCSRFVLTASELRRLFTVKQSQCPPGHVFWSGVSDHTLEETIKEVGGTSLNNQWPPGTVPESIYAWTKTGDNLDQIRIVLLCLFEKSFKITKKNFVKAVEESTGMTLGENDCKLLLKDYCALKGPNWYLKGTIADG